MAYNKTELLQKVRSFPRTLERLATGTRVIVDSRIDLLRKMGYLFEAGATAVAITE